MRHHKRQDLNPLYPGLIDISWEGGHWNIEHDITIQMDGRTLGRFADKQALRQGQTFQVDAANAVFVQKTDYAWIIKFNGKEVVELYDPQKELKTTRYETIFFALFIFVIGLLIYLFPSLIDHPAQLKTLALFSLDGRLEFLLLSIIIALSLGACARALSEKRIGLVFIPPMVLFGMGIFWHMTGTLSSPVLISLSAIMILLVKHRLFQEIQKEHKHGQPSAI